MLPLLLQTFYTLHRSPHTYTFSAAQQPQWQLVPKGSVTTACKSQWNTACCLSTIPVLIPVRNRPCSAGVCFAYYMGEAVLENTLAIIALLTVRASVIILVITHTYKPACSPGTAMASLWISAPATLVGSENSQGGNMEPAAYFLACKTARKRSNFATSWYSGSLANRNSGEPILWKTE